MPGTLIGKPERPDKQLLLSGSPPWPTAGAFARTAPQGDRDHSVPEDGKTSHSEHEFDLDDQDALENALRELGVLDGVQPIDDGENIVIDVRRLKDGGLLEDMNMALARQGARRPVRPTAWFSAYLANYNRRRKKGTWPEAPGERRGAHARSWA